MNENLEAIQNINFLLLKELKRVCDDNNITFFVDSGALIGAVREKDFIKWDDDVDVVFLRSEYEKLCALPKDVWNTDFKFITYQDWGEDVFFDCLTHLFYLPYKNAGGKRVLKKIEDICDPDVLDCICMDIFVLDHTYDSALLHKVRVAEWYIHYGLMLGHRPYLNYKEYSMIPRIIIWTLTHIGKIMPLSKLFDSYEKMCTRIKTSDHVFYSNITLLVATKKFLQKQWWTDGAIDGEIRQETFPIPKRFHDILTYEYGDYMTPPQKNEQMPIHFVQNDK